jgi:hypothetical protein
VNILFYVNNRKIKYETVNTITHDKTTKTYIKSNCDKTANYYNNKATKVNIETWYMGRSFEINANKKLHM